MTWTLIAMPAPEELAWGYVPAPEPLRWRQKPGGSWTRPFILILFAAALLACGPAASLTEGALP